MVGNAQSNAEPRAIAKKRRSALVPLPLPWARFEGMERQARSRFRTWPSTPVALFALSRPCHVLDRNLPHIESRPLDIEGFVPELHRYSSFECDNACSVRVVQFNIDSIETR